VGTPASALLRKIHDGERAVKALTVDRRAPRAERWHLLEFDALLMTGSLENQTRRAALFKRFTLRDG
jgi:hypothetical protein